MPRFLIEVEHDASPEHCTKAVEVFLRTGSHFLRNAEWGCKDSVHKAWMIVEVDTRSEALNIVPPDFRGRSLVVQLNAFELNEKGRVRAKS